MIPVVRSVEEAEREFGRGAGEVVCVDDAGGRERECRSLEEAKEFYGG